MENEVALSHRYGSSCRKMQPDYFCDNSTTPDNGENEKHLTPVEKQALNAYVAEHTTWLNTSYISYAPEDITMPSSRVKFNIRRGVGESR